MYYFIEKIDGIEDRVKAASLSFDGGSLLCFSDSGQKKIIAAYSPTGWIRLREAQEDEIH